MELTGKELCPCGRVASSVKCVLISHGCEPEGIRYYCYYCDPDGRYQVRKQIAQELVSQLGYSY
jgi:hypothetical protein